MRYICLSDLQKPPFTGGSFLWMSDGKVDRVFSIYNNLECFWLKMGFHIFIGILYEKKKMKVEWAEFMMNISSTTTELVGCKRII